MEAEGRSKPGAPERYPLALSSRGPRRFIQYKNSEIRLWLERTFWMLERTFWMKIAARQHNKDSPRSHEDHEESGTLRVLRAFAVNLFLFEGKLITAGVLLQTPTPWGGALQ
jgi:hypothetical protein